MHILGGSVKPRTCSKQFNLKQRFLTFFILYPFLEGIYQFYPQFTKSRLILEKVDFLTIKHRKT